jgi:DNA-binding SARP family transcriptional activator
MCGTGVAAEGYSGQAEGSGSDGDAAGDPGAGPGVARRRRAGPRSTAAAGALGFLALNAGQPVSAGELIDALWREQMPPSAPGTVRTYVYKLRQALGYEALESSSAGYALAAGAARTDLDDFCQLEDQASALGASGALDPAAQRLREAMALWQGRALAGARGHYVDKQRGWLDELRLGVLEERFSVALALGRHAEVVAELTAVVAAEPFRELLMLALYRSGRQTDALASYRQLRAMVHHEIGLDPAAFPQQVHDRILRADLALLTPPPAPARTTPAPIQPARRNPACVAETVRRRGAQTRSASMPQFTPMVLSFPVAWRSW